MDYLPRLYPRWLSQIRFLWYDVLKLFDQRADKSLAAPTKRHYLSWEVNQFLYYFIAYHLPILLF